MSWGKRWQNLNPYDLHKTLINEYFLTAKGSSALLKRDTSKDKRDIDIIRENHQFLWSDDESAQCGTWEKKLAKKYYDKLFKEYCVADLSRYKENKVGMRWRTEKELIDGKGQFCCGNKTCAEKNGLRTWEVNFGYVEHKIKKNALVKLRLCTDCSHKLNYHHKRKEVKRLQHSTNKHKSQLKSKSNNIVLEQENVAENKGETNSNDHCPSTETSDSDIWKQNNKEEEEEKSREDEFEEYLSQLFL